MNHCTIGQTNYLLAAQAQSEARIRRYLGRNHLALVTPELEKELKRAARIAQLIELAMDEWIEIDGL